MRPAGAVALLLALAAAAVAPTAAAAAQVRVYFSRLAADGRPAAECGNVQPVQRERPSTLAVATATLRLLFAGVTPEEHTAGWRSPFSADSADLLKSLRIAGGTAYVDLFDRREVLSAASSSCGAAELHAAIDGTLRQFPSVRRVIVAIDGEPRAYYDWVGLACDASNDHCSARGFRRQR